jgi:hypothetical protein
MRIQTFNKFIVLLFGCTILTGIFNCEKENDNIFNTNAQNKLDSINEILSGKWIWSECIPAPFACFEQPTKEHSRSIYFSNIINSDSLLYETYRNDTIIVKGKTKLTDTSFIPQYPPRCVIINDVIFGGVSIYGDVYKDHGLIIENDTVVKFILGNKKSTLVYKYNKRIYK